LTIFRGPGGGGNATSDSALNALAALTNEAANSATIAGASATAASVSEGNAASSAAAAASSASGASTSAATSTTQASASATSASGASTSASNGAASAAAALASQNAAAASQATASTAATTATTQAGLATTNGAAQVALATTQAGNAATSAAASSTSATGSASSASDAFNSAATATTQAGIATTQAGLATTNGASQVALATTQAGNASTSATGAASSASAASTSASNASTSATNASNSATAAANSAASINDATLVHKTGNETIGGIKTFSSTIIGSMSGNAATVTTNANLTGAVTSVGNAASLGSFTSAQLAGALTDETGSGANVFATSPVLVTPGIKNASSAGVITLAAPVTATNRTLTLPDSTGTLLSTATPGVPIGGPAFSAYKNSGAQSVTSAVFTKITFDTELFDTNNNFASSAFTPSVAGFYQVTAGISTSSSSSISRVLLVIYKNGAVLYTIQDLSIASFRYSGSCLIQFNGTTDVIEIYAYIVGTGIVVESSTGGTGYNTWFQAALVRSAT
jgi:hypothetical protein